MFQRLKDTETVVKNKGPTEKVNQTKTQKNNSSGPSTRHYEWYPKIDVKGDYLLL